MRTRNSPQASRSTSSRSASRSRKERTIAAMSISRGSSASFSSSVRRRSNGPFEGVEIELELSHEGRLHGEAADGG